MIGILIKKKIPKGSYFFPIINEILKIRLVPIADKTTRQYVFEWVLLSRCYNSKSKTL